MKTLKKIQLNFTMFNNLAFKIENWWIKSEVVFQYIFDSLLSSQFHLQLNLQMYFINSCDLYIFILASVLLKIQIISKYQYQYHLFIFITLQQQIFNLLLQIVSIRNIKKFINQKQQKIMSLHQKIKQKAIHLKQIAESLGVLSKDSCSGMYKSLKLVLNPYCSTQAFLNDMKQISIIWQKIVWIASRDFSLINRIFGPLSQSDPMVSNLLDIYNNTFNKNQHQPTFTFFRVDFFQDAIAHQPKIIQYNTMSVSMAALSQKISLAHELFTQFETNPETDFIHCPQANVKDLKNQPLTFFVNSIFQFYRANELKGIILMIVQKAETNVMDQFAVETQFLKKQLKMLRVSFDDLYENTQIDSDNNLQYKGQKVGIVYYRTGYRLNDFVSKKGGNECWLAKKRVEMSNATKIPWVGMELANFKRIQTQLSKPNIYQSYLEQSEWKILEKSLVKVWDFDNLQNHDKIFDEIDKIGKDNIVAKPNKEGGSNNMFGKEAYQFLKSLQPCKRTQFIIMEKIIPPKILNVFVSHNQIAEIMSVSELSHYGMISSKDNTISFNQAEGTLVRTKPQYENEGGIMAGVGAIGKMCVKKINK